MQGPEAAAPETQVGASPRCPRRGARLRQPVCVPLRSRTIALEPSLCLLLKDVGRPLGAPGGRSPGPGQQEALLDVAAGAEGSADRRGLRCWLRRSTGQTLRQRGDPKRIIQAAGSCKLSPSTRT